MRLSPSQRQARDNLIASLRAKGHTYDSIAQELFRFGYTAHTISRPAVHKLIRKSHPELLGFIKRKLGLDRLIHKGDDLGQET